jgi:hypothetical protein
VRFGAAGDLGPVAMDDARELQRASQFMILDSRSLILIPDFAIHEPQNHESRIKNHES